MKKKKQYDSVMEMVKATSKDKAFVKSLKRRISKKENKMSRPKVSIYKVGPGKKKTGKLCWIEVDKNYALLLIKSLVNQLQRGDSNVGRLESSCDGDATELSIAVDQSSELKRMQPYEDPMLGFVQGS